jgi:hypothetical protein
MRAVDKDLVRAEKELSKRHSEVAKAREEEETAKLTYDASGTDEDLDAASKARLRRERQERLVSSAEGVLASAQTARAAQDRVELGERLTQERAELGRFPEVVEPLISQIVALDRELDRLVTAAAISCAEAGQLLAVTRDHCHTLNQKTNDLPTVDLPTFRLALRRRLQEVRTAESREDLSASFLSSADPSWKLKGATAQEVASMEEMGARVKRENELAAVHQAGIAMGINAAAAAMAQKTKEVTP